VLSEEILKCLWAGMTPFADDKPSGLYFEIDKCPEKYRRTLLHDLELLDWDAEMEMHFPSHTGKLILAHYWGRREGGKK
jgi:hypothetical protein